MNRWTVTFLDLANNVPRISLNATSSTTKKATLAPVAGAIVDVIPDVQTLREASAPCCVGGNFSLSFDGVFVLGVDLNNAEHATSEYVQEALEDAIDQGE